MVRIQPDTMSTRFPSSNRTWTAGANLMSAYPRSASQFLASTFAPFGGGGRHAEADAAPLFFSTIDGESTGGIEDDTDDGRSRYYYHEDEDEDEVAAMRQSASSSNAPFRPAADQQRHDAYRQHQPHQARGSWHEGLQNRDQMHAHLSEQDPDDPYNHDGLGRPASEQGSDESNDPFRSNGTRSRQSVAAISAQPHAVPQHTIPNPGWRMHATNLLPNVKQSVLHNLYEQSESVYSSVFIGNKLDKGKQRAVEDEQQNAHVLLSSGSPDEPPRYLTQGGPVSLPLRHQNRSGQPAPVHLDPSGQGQRAATRSPDELSPPRVHRYPMPTARYRRAAMGVKDAPSAQADMQWQDQSYRDPVWLALYLFNLLFTIFLSLYLLLFDSTRMPSSTHLIAPSMAILRSIPLLSLLVFASMLLVTSTLAYTLLIKNGARQAAFLFVLAPPIIFLIGAGWAFEASFALAYSPSNGMQDSASWAQRTLRLTSLCLLVSAGFAFRRSWQTLFSSGSSSRRARLERTIRVLQVSADVILQHPQLIFLAILLVGSYVVSSVPAILVIAQLLYHGTVKESSPASPKDSYTYLVPSTGSILLSLHTAFVYFWSLGLLRAVYQHTIAGTVGSWWYRPSNNGSQGASDVKTKREGELAATTEPLGFTRTQAQQNVLAAFHRATGPSLGTLCASSLILALLSVCTLLISMSYSLINRSRRYTAPNIAATLLRIIVKFVALPLVAVLSSVIRNLNAFTLMHSAITGDRFWDASHEAADLIMGRNGTDLVASHLMIRSLLSIFSFALALLGGLAGYVSSVYWLSAPATFPDSDAKEVTVITPLLVAFICGVVPFWTVRFSSDLLSSAIDATFVCFNIDLDIGHTDHQEAYDAFAYEDEQSQNAEPEEELTYGMSGLYRSDSGESV